MRRLTWSFSIAGGMDNPHVSNDTSIFSSSRRGARRQTQGQRRDIITHVNNGSEEETEHVCRCQPRQISTSTPWSGLRDWLETMLMGWRNGKLSCHVMDIWYYSCLSSTLYSDRSLGRVSSLLTRRGGQEELDVFTLLFRLPQWAARPALQLSPRTCSSCCCIMMDSPLHE